MPTYEYRCPQGHTFELIQRMTDDPPEACEVCGSSPVERLLFAPAIHYKGSGFYATDYGRGKKRKDPGEGGATKEKDGGAKTEAPSASGSSSSESSTGSSTKTSD